MMISPQAFEAVLRFLAERTGLHFAPPRHESAEHGIRRAMARAGMTDPERSCRLL
jgi:hypothetical protein